VRSRQIEDLNADILQGHLSSALCHTGNISYRLGQKKAPGAIHEEMKSYSDLQESFDRMAEHLKKNDVAIDTDQITLGVALRMDPATERFRGNAEADKLLTREYRKPFVVPDRV
jgi:hypothetical protein